MMGLEKPRQTDSPPRGVIAGMQPDGHHRSQECYAASPLAGEVGVTRLDNGHTLVGDDTSGSDQKDRRWQ